MTPDAIPPLCLFCLAFGFILGRLSVGKVPIHSEVQTSDDSNEYWKQCTPGGTYEVPPNKGD